MEWGEGRTIGERVHRMLCRHLGKIVSSQASAGSGGDHEKQESGNVHIYINKGRKWL